MAEDPLAIVDKIDPQLLKLVRDTNAFALAEGALPRKIKFLIAMALAMVIHDGAAVMHGRTTFEAVTDNQTKITTIIEIPGMDKNADKTFLNSRLEHSAQIRKQLMESEIQK